MKKSQTLLMILSMIAPLASASADGFNRPGVEIGYARQSVASQGMRGVFRVSYSGKQNEHHGCGNCGPGSWRGCMDVYYMAFSAQVGLSSDNSLASMDVRVLPFSGQEWREKYDTPEVAGTQADRIVDLAAFPILATREMALGNQLKVRVDLLSISWTAQEFAGDTNQFFVNLATNVLGAKFLRAEGYGEIGREAARNLYGFDAGDAGIAVGAQQYWSEGFRTRLTVGAKGELGLTATEAHGWTKIAQTKEFARLSAVFDTKIGQLEAYLEGSATQMFVGPESREMIQMEFGALGRF